MKVIRDLRDCQLAINEIFEFIDLYRSGNVDLHGRRFTNVGKSVDKNEWVTRHELDIEKNNYDTQFEEDRARLLKIEDRLRKLERGSGVYDT